ncbi:MAG: hypothetical protein HY903_23695 [Deltaproteobacteria bacterium]|nr:hypothetical protein [Deltaproteobacteria bacterium]
MRKLSLWVGVLLWAPGAFAMDPIPGEERFVGKMGEPQNTGGGELGFAKIDEDFYLQLTLRTGLNLGKVGVGLQVPLNLRVVDKDPKNDRDYYGLVRYEDWNEPAKFLKVIRYVRYGYKHNEADYVYALVGELAAQLGHGTIMDRYMNNLDPNTFHLGSALDVYTPYGGVETVVSNYGSVFGSKDGSRIVGGRLYLKPVGLADSASAMNIFAVGASVVTDLNAPRALATEQEQDASGSPVVDANGQPVTHSVTDKDGNLVVASGAAQTVWGVDVEAKVINTEVIQVTPYSDLNFIDGAGWGWHLGTLLTLNMPIGFELSIPVRLEYRRFRSDYIPAYFSTFYELERYAYPTGSSAIGPKAAVARALSSGKGRNGVYGDLAFNFAGLVQVGGIYEWYDDIDPNFALFANVPALQVVQAKAYYTKTGVKTAKDAFTLDDRSLLIAEARYEVVTYVYVVGRFTRKWSLDPDPASDTYNDYVGKNDWKFGVEFSMTF